MLFDAEGDVSYDFVILSGEFEHFNPMYTSVDNRGKPQNIYFFISQILHIEIAKWSWKLSIFTKTEGIFNIKLTLEILL